MAGVVPDRVLAVNPVQLTTGNLPEAAPVIPIAAPIVLSIATTLGIDPVHSGVRIW